jgi:tRNA threonylcarbamoyladenosine modification (KEOPS) complex  Pcc1 subunit
MMWISKKYKVHIKIKIRIRNLSYKTGQRTTKAIVAAIRPEIASKGCSQKINIIHSGACIYIQISTSDTISMRAIFNSFILYVHTAYGCLNR